MARPLNRTSAEVLSRKLLRPQLREALSLAATCDRTLRKQVAQLADASTSGKSEEVLAILLSRIADDLRASVLCATAGYIAQSMTITSALFELGYTVGFVAASEERAKTWLAWRDCKSGPWSRRTVLTGALENALGKDQRDYKKEDVYYVPLCWAKHGNPTIQTRYAIAPSPSRHVLNVDPLVSPRAAKSAEAALWLATKPVMVAVLALYHQKVLSPALERSVISICQRWFDLDERVRARLKSGAAA